MLAASLFVAGSYAAPWLGSVEVRSVYAPLCHQQAERSLAVGGVVQAVCARCAGLYLGGAAGLLLACVWVGRRQWPRPFWLAVACAPTLVDALLPWLGFPGLPNLPRLVVAWPAGVAAGIFLAAGIADLVVMRLDRAPARSSIPSLVPRSRYLEDSDG